MSIDVDGNTHSLQQLSQALELETHHRPTDVVGMVMGDQHSRQVHPIGLQRVEQVTGGVSRVDHDRITGLPVADQVGKVTHLLGDHVTGGKVTSGKQLPEVEAV